MIQLPVLSRVEFGVTRSTCDCGYCRNWCRIMPGYLIPADLERIIPSGVDPLEWAKDHLLASPGAKVFREDIGIFRIGTLVPQTKAGSTACHWHNADGRCEVHATSPFGCAMFSCGTDRKTETLLQRQEIAAVAQALSGNTLYRYLWNELWRTGKRSPGPEASRNQPTKSVEMG